MNWVVLESKDVVKALKKVPVNIRSNYLYWKKLIVNEGLNKLAGIRGFNFEKLRGDRTGQYSCRLSREYRIIFEIRNEELCVLVLEINKHEY
jgi:mRNA-degrading endonuclease RelE of RelBE toxin-antitoxin system